MAEFLADLFWDADDLERAVFAGTVGLVAQLLDLGTELRRVDRTDDCLVVPELAIMQRAPLPVLRSGHVGDDDVDMALRIERAARVVLEHRRHQVASANRNGDAVLLDARFGEICSGELYGFLDRFTVCLKHALVAANERYDRYRL